MIRYGLLGFSGDIIEVRALAASGGVGPLGPKYERMFWDSEGEKWTLKQAVQPTE